MEREDANQGIEFNRGTIGGLYGKYYKEVIERCEEALCLKGGDLV